MKSFANRFVHGGFGGALGIVFYSLLLNALFAGKLPPVRSLASQGIFVWVAFGLLFALIHLKRVPTLGSSLVSGFVFVAALSLSFGLGAVTSINFVVVAALLLLSMLLGTCSYFSSTKASRGPVIAGAVLIFLGLL